MSARRSLLLLAIGFAAYPTLAAIGPSLVRASVGPPGSERGPALDAMLGGLPATAVLRGDPDAARALLRRLAPHASGLLDDDPPGARRDPVDAVLSAVPRRRAGEGEAEALTRHLTALSAAEVEALENVVPLARSLTGGAAPPPPGR